MRDIIHRERQVELSCEGSYYWDTRRWKTAEKELNRIVQGWNVLNGETAEDYYIPTNIYNQQLKSEYGKGSRFTLTLPKERIG